MSYLLRLVVLLPVLICLAACSSKEIGTELDQESVEEPRWFRNTFPGIGHLENEGPWGPYQGTDRTEWISSFGVHPANGNFMLQMTDLGRLVYTNTELGGVEFVPAELPLANGSTIAFHPHEPQTAYALMYSTSASGLEGWWRTTDEGETWHRWLDVGQAAFRFDKVTRKVDKNIAYGRGSRSLLLLNPDPQRKSHIYVGTAEQGILISKDNGESWSSLIELSESIGSMHLSADGNMLYYVLGRQEWEGPWALNKKGKGSSLYRVNLGDAEPKAELIVHDEVFDIVPHPERADAGLFIMGDDLVPFSEYGARLWPSRLNLKHLGFAKINPANPDHWIAVGRGNLWDKPFRWTTDAGKTWQHWAVEGEFVPNLIDYAPINYRSDGYQLANVDSNKLMMRRLADFLPGDPDSVVFWGSNFLKAPMRSDDYGEHFVPFAHGGNFKQGEQTAFGQTDLVQAHSVREYGFRFTRDGGLSWKGVSRYNNQTISSVTPEGASDYMHFATRSAWGIAIDPRNDLRVIATYAAKPTQIILSEDFGETWRQVGEIPDYTYNGQFVFWHLQDHNVIYAGNRRSDDNGVSFSTELAHTVTSISVSNGDLLLSKHHNHDWFVSTDRGATWVQLPVPPRHQELSTLVLDGQPHKWASLDPSAEHNPALGNPIRVMVGGLDGVWEYVGGPVDGIGGGEWKRIPFDGWSPDSEYNQSLEGGRWFSAVIFDTRPGFELIAYAFPAIQSAGRGRGDQFYRQLYRSEDGGRTWLSLYEYGGELPDYLCINAASISPHSGDLYIQDYAGQYELHWDGQRGVSSDEN